MSPVILRKIFALAALASLIGCANAAGDMFTGKFQGTGRQCRGLLQVQADVIAWQTPFASCAKTPYKILDSSPVGSAVRRVFLLEPAPSCSFSVIALEQDAARPEVWNAAGYRSQRNYRDGSADRLLCNLTRASADALRNPQH
jgi:hypothetical protein